jgi:hypothetical protein
MYSLVRPEKVRYQCTVRTGRPDIIDSIGCEPQYPRLGRSPDSLRARCASSFDVTWVIDGCNIIASMHPEPQSICSIDAPDDISGYREDFIERRPPGIEPPKALANTPRTCAAQESASSLGLNRPSLARAGRFTSTSRPTCLQACNIPIRPCSCKQQSPIKKKAESRMVMIMRCTVVVSARLASRKYRFAAAGDRLIVLACSDILDPTIRRPRDDTCSD